MEMDIDDKDYLDILEDKTQQFLLTKLEELKLQNESLQAELTDIRVELAQSSLQDFNCLEISDVWKRVLNHKCIIGFKVKLPKSVTNINVLLNIDNEHLTYTVKMFNLCSERMTNQKNSPYCWKDHALISNAIHIFDGKPCRNEKDIFVTACFDLPEFLQKHSFVVNGNIHCTSKIKIFNIPFPRVDVSVADDVLKPNKSDENNTLATLLASVSCYNAREWNLRTAECPVDFRKLFQAHCSLTYVTFGSEGYFLSNRNPLYGQLAIIVVNEYKVDKNYILNFKIFTEKRKQYILLSHLIFQCMKQIFGENLPVAGNHDLALIQCEHEPRKKLDDIIADLKDEIHNLLSLYENNSFSASRLELNNIESKLDSTYVQVFGDG